MPGTYSQLYIQLVFAVRGRENLIGSKWKDQLHKYIAGTIIGKKQKPLIINSASNHIHILLGFRPDVRISDIARDIKIASNKFINDKNFAPRRFYWQEGYGAFTYSQTEVDKVYQYIANQEEHHKTLSFKEEYVQLLNDSKIEFGNDYLFDWID